MADSTGPLGGDHSPMKAPSPLRVLIVDDHLLVRVGIKALLGQLPGYVVCGEAMDGRELEALVASLAPDIVLMDIAMPHVDGLSAAKALRLQHSQAKVVILSALETRDALLGALAAGAAGYLVKDCLLAELELCLNAVVQGNTFISPKVAGYLAEAARSEHETASDQPSIKLTEQQQRVLAGIAQGLSAKQIARHLDISPKTVEFHRAQITERLGTKDTANLVKIALRMGLTSL